MRKEVLTKNYTRDVALAFMIGVCLSLMSNYVYNNNNSDDGINSMMPFTTVENPTTTSTGPKVGSILRLSDVPVRKTSHTDQSGQPIIKQQFIEAFAVPNFVGVSMATFKPGQVLMPPHQHDSLHEFFYVVEGKGRFHHNGQEHELSPGTFMHTAPLEPHGFWVPSEHEEDLKMLVCGVTVGEKKDAN